MRLERQGRLSSHWTTVFSDHSFGALVVCLTLVHWILSAHLPLAEDELYYLAWSKELSLSFFDHPPMVALLIRISTSFFGDNAFGVRFFSTLITSIIVLCLAHTMNNRRLLTMALFTPLFFWVALLMTPDIPLVLFWTFYYLWSVEVATQLSRWGDDPVSRVYRYTPVSTTHWLVGGTFLGLGCLSKYTMFLAPICLFINLLAVRKSAWWKGFCLHMITAATLTTPVWIFNYQYDFAPLLFQLSHGLTSDTPIFRFFLEYLGSQVILIGCLPLVMAFWQLLRISEIYSLPATRIAFLFFAVPFFFFLFSAARTKTEGNWSVMAYVSFWPLVQSLYDHSSFRRESLIAQWICFAPAFLITGLIAIHLVWPIKWISPPRDRIHRLAAEKSVFKQIAKDSAGAIFATTYQNTAALLYAGARAFQLPGSGRQSHFTLDPQSPCEFDEIRLLLEDSQSPTLNCFQKNTLERTYDVYTRGSLVRRLYLTHYQR